MQAPLEHPSADLTQQGLRRRLEHTSQHLLNSHAQHIIERFYSLWCPAVMVHIWRSRSCPAAVSTFQARMLS